MIMVMKRHYIFSLWLALALLPGCASHQPDTTTATSAGQLRRLGNHSMNITTVSAEAQDAYNRGLTLTYAFAHYAAEQEYRRALRADPDCAMAWWGIALVNGPHINYPVVTPEHAATAWEALGQAKARAGRTTPLEQALINALAERYANPQPENRRPLDEAYAEAMRQVWGAYPTDADVTALFAEALMDVHPWDLWTKDGPRPWTPEIVAAIERALELNPQHPGANHYYIHAVEASPNPEKAVAAADRLRTLVPDSSHLVHMPAHIYARVARWDDAAAANRDAMKADAVYRAAYPRPGFYAMYMAHNAHFLGFVAMMQGQSEQALECARTMVAGVPEDFRKEYAPVADGFLIFPSEVLMRFGRWEEVLAEPEPPPQAPLSRAMWHFTRTSALIALKRMEEARAEKAAFDKAAAAVPPGWQFGQNYATNLLAIARNVLAGEMFAQAGELDDAIASLQEAVKVEDTLLYNEPPDWIQPVRHTLGAVLLRAGQAPEAAQVYREDLRRYPENGWALMGLRDALRRQGEDDVAKSVDSRFRKAWAGADVKPPSTCYCQAGSF
jgi:tetratricopeptide (TPR) repeat protein